MTRAAFLLLLVAVSACGLRRSAPPEQRSAAPAWTPLPAAERVYYDNGGGIRDSLTQVVRDPDTLAEVWTRATSRQTVPPPLPGVDFERQMLLVIAAGRQTPSDQLVVDSIGIRRRPTAMGDDEAVFTAFARLVEGCHRFQADAYPVEIVRVPRFDGLVAISVARAKQTDCP